MSEFVVPFNKTNLRARNIYRPIVFYGSRVFAGHKSWLRHGFTSVGAKRMREVMASKYLLTTNVSGLNLRAATIY